MIVLMHSTLMQLDDTIEPFGKPTEDPMYHVEGFEGPKLVKAQSVSSTPNSFSNKKPRQKSALNSESKRPRQNVSAMKSRDEPPQVAKSTAYQPPV